MKQREGMLSICWISVWVISLLLIWYPFEYLPHLTSWWKSLLFFYLSCSMSTSQGYYENKWAHTDMKCLGKKALWKCKTVSLLIISLDLDHFLSTFIQNITHLLPEATFFRTIAFWKSWKWSPFPQVYWFSENNTCWCWCLLALTLKLEQNLPLCLDQGKIHHCPKMCH